jgi:hypothetical protein
MVFDLPLQVGEKDTCAMEPRIELGRLLEVENSETRPRLRNAGECEARAGVILALQNALFDHILANERKRHEHAGYRSLS